MYFLELPDIGQQKLSFYLAAEEYAARELDVDSAFFYWQVEPTVIFGRNQNMESEVNVEYCRRHNINMFRRKSGGGCVYADLDNLMLCYIAKGDDVQLTYSNYITLVSAALKRLNLNVEANGRNDITIDGKKVSGSAFYHLPNGKNIVHGTLLYDTNLENMTASLTPPSEKLVAKGVESVRSRIAFLKDHTAMSLDSIKSELRRMICGEERLCLTGKDIGKIREIEKTYLDPDFLYGKGKHWNLTKKGRIEGCGDLQVNLSLRNGIICDIEMDGDFFALENPKEEFFAAWRGKRLDTEELGKVFGKFPPEKYIRGLSADALLGMLTE